jgi:hypothetical protein
MGLSSSWKEWEKQLFRNEGLILIVCISPDLGKHFDLVAIEAVWIGFQVCVWVHQVDSSHQPQPSVYSQYITYRMLNL